MVPAMELGPFPRFPLDFMSPNRRSGGAAKKSSRSSGSDAAPLRERTAPSRGAADARKLLSRARQGNGECLGELLTLYRNYLSLLATNQLERRLRPRVSPSDIVQETMLKAHPTSLSSKAAPRPSF